MSAEYVEVVAVRRDATAPAAETTAVRLLGLLSGQCAGVPEVEEDRVRLRIRLEGTGGPEAVFGAVGRVLSDSALQGWVWCDARGEECS